MRMIRTVNELLASLKGRGREEGGKGGWGGGDEREGGEAEFPTMTYALTGQKSCIGKVMHLD